MTRYGNRARCLRVELLEPRALLAGNVAASVVRGNLVLSGDSQDNAFSIESGPNPGDFVIVGRLDAGNTPAATTINQQTQVTVHGVTKSVSVNLGGGSDDVIVGNSEALPGETPPVLAIPRDLNIFGNTGADSVVVDGVQIGGNLSINMGTGASTGAQQLIVHNAQVVGSIAVRAPQGDADIQLREGGAGKAVSVIGGVGEDRILVDAFNVKGSLTLDGGLDTDSVQVVDSHIGRSLTVLVREWDQELESDAETLTLSGLEIGGDLFVRTGMADEWIDVFDTQVAGRATFFTGMGNDTVNIGVSQAGDTPDGISANSLTIDTGMGNDTVNVTRSTIAKDFVLSLGFGRNFVDLEGDNLVSGRGRFFGSGKDGLHAQGENHIDDFLAFGFATKDPLIS